MMRRVLHPSDFSTASGAAFKKAIDMAKASRAELLVAHVISPMVPVTSEGYLPPKMYDEIAASNRAWAKKQLDRLVAKARQAGVRATALLAEGAAHEQIIRLARAKRADLVVMGTHGRSGLARLFLGSVAGRVVTAARCPVLTVRGK
jgi:nucleotide-binding universal stress UspA family protein